MRFRVLGLVSVVDDAGGNVDLGARQQRLVLALLLANPSEGLSADGLISNIWGESPPATARKTIQGYVAGLRKALGDDLLVRRGTGYTLNVNRAAVDALVFEDGLAATAEAEPAIRRRMLSELLDLWSGAAFEGFEDVLALGPTVERLESLRLRALTGRIEADIACGDAAGVVAELTGLVESFPLQEELRALHALALYRTGRQVEALRVVDEARRYLSGELGVEPSRQLLLVEQRIFDQDPLLDSDDPLGSETKAEAGGNPYRGLRAFTAEDAASFFGRDDLVRRLVDAVERRSSSARLVVLAGASGSGKSSVMRAGLEPVLRRRGGDVRLMYPGAEPLTALEALGELGPESTLLVDQFEEVFTMATSEQQTFLDTLVELATRPDGPWVVATIRADYLGHAMTHAPLASHLDEALVLVPPMSEHEIRSAIVEPARQVGVVVEPELAIEMAAEIAGLAAALPLLQFSLTDLFDRRGDGALTRADYQAAGGLAGAISRRADELFLAFDGGTRADARQIVERLVTIGGEGEAIRRRLRRSDLDDVSSVDRILGEFGQHRLLTFDRDPAGHPTVELAHDTLLAEWPRLSNWVNEARLDLAAYRRLNAVVVEWQTNDENDEYLLSGSRLEQYALWPIPTVVLSADDIRYLDQSRATARSRLAAARARRRAVTVGLVAIAVVGVGLSAFAFLARQDASEGEKSAQESQQQAEASQKAAEASQAIAELNEQDADQARAAAEIRSIANEALLQMTQDPQLGLLLAAEAYAADPQQVGPLLAGLGSTPGRVVLAASEQETGTITGTLNFLGETSFTFPLFCADEVSPGIFVTVSEEAGTAVLTDVVSGQITRVPVPFSCNTSMSPDRRFLLGDSVPMQIVSIPSGNLVTELDPRIVRAQWGTDGRILGITAEGVGITPEGDLDRFDLGFANRRGELAWVDPITGDADYTGVMAVDFDVSPDGAQVLIFDVAEQRADVVTTVGAWSLLDGGSLESLALDPFLDTGSMVDTVWSGSGQLRGNVSRFGSAEVGTDFPLERIWGFGNWQADWISIDFDGTRVAVARKGGFVRFFSLSSVVDLLPPLEFSTEIAATSFLRDGRFVVVRDSGVIEVFDLSASAFIQNAEPFVDASVEVSSEDWSITNPNFASQHDGSDVTIRNLRNEEQWVLSNFGQDETWIRADGHAVAFSGESIRVYDQAGREAMRAQPFGELPPTVEFLLAANIDDQVSVAVVTAADQFGFPEEFSLGVLDLATLEFVEGPHVLKAPSGTIDLFLTSEYLFAYNPGGGTVTPLGVDGEIAPRLEVEFAVEFLTAYGDKVVVGGERGIMSFDLRTSEMISSRPSVFPGPALLVSEDHLVLGQDNGELGIWSADTLLLLGVLSSREPKGASLPTLALDPPNQMWFFNGAAFERIAIDPQTWAEKACAAAGRSLTVEEWQRLVSPTREYDPAC